MLRQTTIVVSVFVWAALGGGFRCQIGATEPNSVPVVCPAIQKDDERGASPRFLEPTRTIELVVRGAAAKTEEKEPDGDFVFEFRVDEVLYGSWSDKTIRFSWRWVYPKDCQIIALVSNPDARPAPWIFKYGHEATPELLAGARALAEARLAYNVLSAKCIFVGHDVRFLGEDRKDGRRDYLLSIRFLRAVSGGQPAQDTELIGLVRGSIWRSKEPPVLNRATHIYLIGAVVPNQAKGEPYHVVSTTLGLECEDAVRRVLAEREKFPVRQAALRGRAIAYREIVFQGPPAEAVSMLKLPSDGAVLLATRSMAAKPGPHRPLVVKEIENELFRFMPQKDKEFAPLQNLIRALAAMEAEEKTGAISRLIATILARVEANQDIPADITRPVPARWRHILMSEETRHDVNHALTWLVHHMEPAEVRKEFGARLLRLETAAQGNWQKEVKLAAEMCQLHDGYEVDEAMQAMSGVKPRRSEPGQFRRLTDLHVSPDGKQIRTLANNNLACLWDAQSLKLVASRQLPKNWKVVSLRPTDGKYGIVFDGWDPGSSVVEMELGGSKLASVDMDTGKKLADIPGKVSLTAFRMHWVNDREAMRSDSNVLQRFDCFTGKATVRRFGSDAALTHGVHGHLTEDGKTIFLARPGEEAGTAQVESLDLESGKVTDVGQFKLPAQTGSKNGLVPGEKYFYLADPGVHIFDRKTLAPLSLKHIRYRDLLSISFSGSGDRYAVVTADRVFRGPRNEVETINQIMTVGVRPAGKPLEEAHEGSPTTVRVHDAQTGKTLFAFPARTPWASATLSRDGQTVYVCNDDGTFEVWDLPDKR